MMLPKHSAECRELLQKIPLTKIFSLFFFPCCTCMCIIYDKLYAALRNNAWVKGIKRASPLAQTTCLEGFHSVLNHFMPKMIAYSYIGMYCSWTCFSLDLYLILRCHYLIAAIVSIIINRAGLFERQITLTQD